MRRVEVIPLASITRFKGRRNSTYSFIQVEQGIAGNIEQSDARAEASDARAEAIEAYVALLRGKEIDVEVLLGSLRQADLDLR